MAYVPVSSCQNRKEGLEENASLLLKSVEWNGMADEREKERVGYVPALVEIASHLG